MSQQTLAPANESTDSTTPAKPARPRGRLVTGTVRRYFPEKGFGFAEINGERGPGNTTVEVFFHKTYCRTVKGDADKPVLTREPIEQYVTGTGRNPSRIVMLIVPGEKGHKAIAWGVIPHRDWRVDLLNRGGLDQYIGGPVRSARNHGRDFRGCEYEGTLSKVELTREQLVIHIGDPQLRNRDGFYVETGQPTLTLTYDLESARPDSRGRYAIIVPEGDNTERRISFFPPETVEQR